MGTTHQVLAGKLGGGAGGTVKETLLFRPEGLVTDLQLYVHPSPQITVILQLARLFFLQGHLVTPGFN